MKEKPAIHDPAPTYEVTTSDGSVLLTMHFQDGEHPDRVARVVAELEPPEALHLAKELETAAGGRVGCRGLVHRMRGGRDDRCECGRVAERR